MEQLTDCTKNIFELGANVDLCNVSPDGKNINQNCGVLNPKLLIEKMENSDYDYAIGFDGDGDRVIFIDKDGEFIMAINYYTY